MSTAKAHDAATQRPGATRRRHRPTAVRGFLMAVAATVAWAALTGLAFDDGRPASISSSSLYAWVWAVLAFVGATVLAGAGTAIRSHRWRRFALGSSVGALVAATLLTAAMMAYLLAQTS